MKYLCVIPARMGSKSIKRKNTRWLHGKPLVSWTLEIAKELFPSSTIVTTDDPQITALAHQAGLRPLRRPPWLCEDETPMIDVITHALTYAEEPPDAVVLFQPTQPFRRVLHVKMGLKLFEMSQPDSVVSVTPVPQHYAPEWQYTIRDGQLRQVMVTPPPSRRQDVEPSYTRDGTVYITKRDIIDSGSLYGRDIVPLVIPADESCNLDTPDDWKRAEGMVMPCP